MRRFQALKIAALVGLAPVAWSADPPTSVDPSRLFTDEVRRLDELSTTREDPAKKIETKRGAKQNLSALARVKFKLESIILHGSQTKQEVIWQRLNELTKPHIGRTTSLADVQQIADRLEQLYRSSGYILAQVFIPPQHLDKEGAYVKLQVIEGRIDDIKVAGGTRQTNQVIDGYAQNVENKRPLVINDLEQFILLSNDVPGASVKTVLVASQETQGAADIQAIVDQKRIGGYLSMNNLAGDYTGPNQVQAGVTLYSMFGADALSLNTAFVIPHSNRLRYVGTQYQKYVGLRGASVNFAANYSSSHPEGSLIPLGLEGAGKYAEGSYRYPFVRSKKQDLHLEVGGYFRDSENRSTTANATFYEDKVRAVFAKLDWVFNDFTGGFNDFRFQATQGLRIASASHSGDPFLSRALAEGDFLKFTVEAAHTQPLVNGLSLFSAFKGQHSDSRLLSSEQFGYGGSRFGSGYDSSEISGDKGYAVRLELRHDYNPMWPGMRWLQSYGFWDIGQIFNDTVGGQESAQSGASAGLGARFSAEQQITGLFEYALPLTREISSTNDTKGRFFFNLTSRV